MSEQITNRMAVFAASGIVRMLLWLELLVR